MSGYLDGCISGSRIGVIRIGNVREVTQSITGPAKPDSHVYGNCLQAAIASALGLDLDAVPHFGAFDDWEPAVRLWLSGHSLDWQQADRIPAGRSIVIGPTVRSTGNHAVVGDDGKIVWDPHPTRTGLTEVICSYSFVKRAKRNGCWYCGRAGDA